MEIKDKLKMRRKEIGLTMLEVAQKVGVSEATVSRWESGYIANMKRDKIVLLANALNVSPSYIMEWSNHSTTHVTQPQLTHDEEDLVTNYRSLDDDGKFKASEYLSDLAKLNNLNIHKIDDSCIPSEPDAEKHSKEDGRKYANITFEDNTERIAAFGGVEENDDEPLIT